VTRIRIVVQKDQMAVEATASAGTPSDAAAVHVALAAAGVVHGIDEAKAQQFGAQLGDATFAGTLELARGTPIRPGCDGHFEPSFAGAPLPGFRAADGALDYRERGFLHPAAEGSQLGIVHPPQDGVPGTTCLGRPLAPPKTKAITLRTGPGATIDAAGRVFALRDGVVSLTSQGIDVLPLFVHEGDVTLRTGNLHTHGSLQVKGDVGAGFSIEADGDVDVQGCIFGSNLQVGGNARIGLGAQQGSRIEACGDIRCRHATSSTLLCKGSIVALDELVRCEATAAEIRVTDGRGCVLGGTLRARDAILVLQAGSESGVATLLSAADVASESANLLRASAQLERTERLAQKASPRTDGPMRGGKLGREQTAAQDAALREKVALAQRQRELLTTARIEVRGVAHPGVRIRLGNAEHVLDSAVRAVRFRWDGTNNAIVQEPT